MFHFEQNQLDLGLFEYLNKKFLKKFIKILEFSTEMFKIMFYYPVLP
jgi:hypothetical protein